MPIVSTMKLQVFEQGKLPFHAVLMTEPSDFPNAFLGVGNDFVRTDAKYYAAVWYLEKPGNGAQQRRFSRAVGTMYRKNFTAGKGKVDMRLEQAPLASGRSLTTSSTIVDTGQYIC
jgi:hypothetical protein